MRCLSQVLAVVVVVKINIPSDTKLILTKHFSETIIFGKITNLVRNSLKMFFFPGHFESTECLKNYEK